MVNRSAPIPPPLSIEAVNACAVFDDFLINAGNRLNNRARLHAEFSAAAPVVTASPLRLQVYLTDRCNARCVMCQGMEGLQWTPFKKPATFEQFMTAFEEHLPYAERCDMHGIGEVLIHKKTTLQILNVLSANRVSSSLVTNGHLLTPANVAALRGAGLDHIVISIDAVEDELYAAIRRNLHWSTTRRNLEHLLSVESIPSIEFNFVMMRLNIEQMDKLVRFIHSIHRNHSRISFSFYLLAYNFLGEMQLNDFFRTNVFYTRDREFLQDKFTSLRALCDQMGYPVNFPDLVKLNEPERDFNAVEQPEPVEYSGNLPACSRPWDTYYLLPGGNGKVCCYNPIPFNSIPSRNSPELQQLRTAVNDPAAYRAYPACTYCSERSASDLCGRTLQQLPPLHLNYPVTQIEGVQILLPALCGSWQASTQGEPALIARRDRHNYSDAIFTIQPGCQHHLYLEYLDVGCGEVRLFAVHAGEWIPLAGLQLNNTGARMIGAVPVDYSFLPPAANPNHPIDAYLILETHGQPLAMTRLFVTQIQGAATEIIA